MKVWILSADATTDVSGSLLSSGGVVGVYATRAAAEAALALVKDEYEVPNHA